MANDLPLETFRTDDDAMTGFRSRLLRACEQVRQGDDGGIAGFGLVEQLFPIECQVYSNAVSELMARLATNGATPEQVVSSLGLSRRLLCLTLVPYIEAYLTTSSGMGHGDSGLEGFRRLAKPWAVLQLRRSTVYIVGLTINEYARQLEGASLSSPEEQRMEFLMQRITQFEQQPEAATLVARDRRELQRLAEVVSAGPELDPMVPRALSFLLGQTTQGKLRDNALAALLLKGNSSPGNEVVANPMQILGVAEVAASLDLPPASVTASVSRIRSNARRSSGVASVPYELDPRLLWSLAEPDPADAATWTTNRNGNGHG